MDILILDDEPKSALLAKMLLEKMLAEETQIRITHSFSALQTQLQIQSPDLFLLDIEVNGQSAFDFLKKMHGLPFPFFITTASKNYCFEAFEFGAMAYLLKPLAEEDLFVALSRIKRIFHWKENLCHWSM